MIKIEINNEAKFFDDVYQAIMFLETFKKQQENNSLNEQLSEFFKKHPHVSRLLGSAAGTYYKYELSGETYEHEPDGDWIELADEIYLGEDEEGEEIYQTLEERYPGLDEEEILDLIGADAPDLDIWDMIEDFPQRGGLRVYASHDDGYVFIETEKYDPE